MPRASSPPGALFDVTPVAPPWVCTSTETVSRRSLAAASAGTAEVAAAGPLPEAEQAASAAPVEVTSAFHIHCRRVKVCAQHVMAISSVKRV
jgi:hypothetical protein